MGACRPTAQQALSGRPLRFIAHHPAAPGDANGDTYVDDDDLSLLLASWGTDTDWANGEFSGTPPVDDDDLSLLLANWTGAPPAPISVPEPASAALLVLGGLAVLRRRRK